MALPLFQNDRSLLMEELINKEVSMWLELRLP